MAQEGDTEGRIHYEGMIHFGGGGDNIYTIKYVFSSCAVDRTLEVDGVDSEFDGDGEILGNNPIISCVTCCLESD